MFTRRLSASKHWGRHAPERYPKDSGYIYTDAVFRRVLRHEIAMADRSGCGFCLVEVTLPQNVSSSDEGSCNRVIEVAGDMLRVTDLAGWLENGHRLALLLFGCPVDAAQGFVQRLRNGSGCAELQCRIYEYPGDLPQSIGSPNATTPCTNNSVEGADCLEMLSSPAEFREELQRMQARTERSGTYFSIVIFRLGFDGERTRDGCVAGAVLHRCREADFAGWFDCENIGVILDSTPLFEAMNFGNSVCAELSVDIMPLQSCTIQTFPAEFCRVENGDAGMWGEGSQALVPTAVTIEYGALAGVERRAPVGVGLPLWKRVLDVTIATLVLLLLSPLLAVIAILIAVTSPGGIIYRQERIGYLGHPFQLYKFRSMRVDRGNPEHKDFMKHVITENDEEPMLKQKGNPDKRTTWIGRIIRATSLDEIPQLVNVLQGSMSLVGPRPPIPYEAELYKRWHGGRFDSVPGLTGLWQVSGKNKLSFKEMARLDIRYSRDLSLWGDIVILAKTPGVVIRECLETLRGKKEVCDLD